MANMRHMGGFVTLRDFKTYLIMEGVRSQTDIQVLYEHFEIVIKTYKRVNVKNKTAEQSQAELSMGWGMNASEDRNTTARQVYQNLKRIIDADESGASASHKSLAKNTCLPQGLAQSAMKALSFQAQEAITQALIATRQWQNSQRSLSASSSRDEISVFDLADRKFKGDK